MKFIVIFVCFIGISFSFSQNKIKPGEQWNDNDGVPINAHGGCVVFDKGMYYWFGEDRTGSVSNGVSCYKSTDLYNWKRMGLAMESKGPFSKDNNDIGKGRLYERPKVLYNKMTMKWIMWSHWENGTDYSEARVCVAISDRPEGPYKLYKTYRPNNHDSRDQTLFKDTDGSVYHFAATDVNQNILITLLQDNWLEPTTTETKVLKGEKYEAPSIFKVGDTYFGFFSHATGWDPNPGRLAYSKNILGDWHGAGNFAVDELKELTYKSQSAYVFKVEGKENAYVYMGDRWNSKNVGASTSIWLPVSMRSGYPTVRWYDSWDLSVFDDMYRYKRAKTVVGGNIYFLLERQSNRLVSKPQNGFTIANDDDNINLSLEFVKTNTPNVYKLKNPKTGKFMDSMFGSLRLSTENSADSQNWEFSLQEDGYYKIMNVADGKYLSISGNSTFNGANLYLADLDDRGSQNFGVYFDSKNYKYEEAKIF